MTNNVRMTKKHLGEGHRGGGADIGYGDPDDGQDYVDRSHLDFDPADGLLSGTALPPHHGGWLAHDEAPTAATGEPVEAGE